MINTASQAISNTYGIVASLLAAPLAIIVNVIGQIKDVVGNTTATLIGICSLILIILTIRGKLLSNKKTKLEIKALEKDN